MGFILRDYAELKLKFDRQVLTLVGSHKVSTEDKLPLYRKNQVKFLRTCESLLDAPVDDSALNDKEESEKTKILKAREIEKSRTLSGLMLIVRHEIDNSHYLKSGDNGVFSGGLDEAIGISDDNKLDSNSAAKLISAAMKFLVAQSFEKGDTTKPLILNHPFFHIEGFDWLAFWKRGALMQESFVVKIGEEATANMKKTIAESKEVTGGFFGGWLGGSKAKPEEKEKKLEVDVNFTM